MYYSSFLPGKITESHAKMHVRDSRKTHRARQTSGMATNVSLDVTQLDLHGDDDESMQYEFDGQFYAPSALRRAHKRFQLRDDNDKRSINP